MLKKNKAVGIDDLSPILLKDCASAISKPLGYIINMSIQTATVPTEWKTAKITPILKSGSPSETDNYRPISILPTLSKILEKIVHEQLSSYLEENKLLWNMQFGYRTKRSTEGAITLFLDNIRKEVDTGKLVGVVFFDLSKAFDSIDHEILLKKLRSLGTSGDATEWFRRYLTD